MILVTGAGGHLGANMVRRLLADGLPVRAMLHTARDRPSVEGLPVESVVGDLRDAAFAAASARGCRQIYHCAAKVSTTYRNKDDIFAANVLGTRNILNAARSAAVEKVVVTGSFSAVGNPVGSSQQRRRAFQSVGTAFAVRLYEGCRRARMSQGICRRPAGRRCGVNRDPWPL